MPTTPARVRLLLATAGIAALAPLLAWTVAPGTALAAVNEPCQPQPLCEVGPASPTPTPTPIPEPTETETATPPPTPRATTTSTPSPTRTATRSPRARATVEAPDDSGSYENPVTGSVVVGSLAPGELDSPVAKAAQQSDDSGGSDTITRTVTLVLGLGVLLGLAGGTGLYLTRHRHEH